MRNSISFCGLFKFLPLLFLYSHVPLLADESKVVPNHLIYSKLRVREHWSTQNPTVGWIEIDEHATLLESIPRWRKVRLDNGRVGFVSKSYSKVINTKPLQPRQLNELRIHHLPIGAGTCTLIECPGANTSPIMMDCGSFGSQYRSETDMTLTEATDYVERILSSYPQPPILVISHADKDHYGWTDDVLGTRDLKQIWLGGSYSRYPASFRTWIEDRVDTENLKKNLDAGWHNNGNPIEALQCGDAESYVLTVNAGDDNGSEKNGDSLMLSIELDDFVAVFSGDAEDETEISAITNFPGTMKATVVSASHHGARTEGSNGLPNKDKSDAKSGWVDKTAPEVVIYSAGTGYKHPHCDVRKQYLNSLANVSQPHWIKCGDDNGYEIKATNKAEYVTENNGVIVVTINGKSPLHVHCNGNSQCDDLVNF